MSFMDNISESDPQIACTMNSELKRIREGLEMIPSENYVSKAVMQAIGSIFTNKYSEGYSHKRYYGGQEFVDQMEDIAVERAKRLFGAEHVNVQPYSGSPANMAVFFTLLNYGDKFMGLDLCAGGHLTHGSPVNFSGKLFKSIPYFVDKKTETLDMDAIRKLALKERPKMIISGYTAYPRKIDFKEFQEICEEIEAYHMSDISHIAGLCAKGVHQSPVPFADVVTTTTHKTLRGPRGAIIMCKKEDRLKEKHHPDWKKDLAGMIDFNVFPGMQGGPHDHVNAAKAVAFGEALKIDFKHYAEQIVKNAKALAEELMEKGIKLVSDGTDNHLMLIDLRPNELMGKGKELQNALDKAGITLNKNTVPFDTASPFNPSGLRLGTPALTTRGMKESDMKAIGEIIARIINDEGYAKDKVLEKARQDVLELCRQHPLYPGLEILR
jgi:glycine hydroxymethyltransferase